MMVKCYRHRNMTVEGIEIGQSILTLLQAQKYDGQVLQAHKFDGQVLRAQKFDGQILWHRNMMIKSYSTEI